MQSQLQVLGFGFNALGQVDNDTAARPVCVPKPQELRLSAAVGHACRGGSEAHLAASWSVSGVLLPDGYGSCRGCNFTCIYIYI